MGKVLLFVFVACTVSSVVLSLPSRSALWKKIASKRQGYYNMCPYDEYECMDGSGCAKYCNGVQDCMDGEDEKWCGCPDPMNEMHCNDGVSCYEYNEYCDGNQDCPDGTDETYCGCADPSDYYCNDGIECYKPDQYCDGTQQCSDGSDEMWCPCTDPNKDYNCNDGIQCAGYCDGNRECSDGEDEEYCDNSYYTTPSYYWTDSWNGNTGIGSNCGYGSVKECINGNCVDVYDICNGYDSCSSMENEWFCEDYHDNYDYFVRKTATRSLDKKADDKILRVKAYEMTRSRHAKGNKNKATRAQRLRQRTLQRKATAKRMQEQKKIGNLRHLLAGILKQKLAARKLGIKK